MNLKKMKMNLIEREIFNFHREHIVEQNFDWSKFQNESEESDDKS